MDNKETTQSQKPGDLVQTPQQLTVCLAVLTAILSVVLVMGLASAGLRPAHAAGSIIYVDADANGSYSGADWADAYTNVQDGLAAAAPNDEIWVAEGVYYPDEGTGQIANSIVATFQLTNGVAIYGGFAATETLRSQRDWETNITVLSGDIDNNDIADANYVITDTANINGSNSYHVVTGSGTNNTAVLDGFTVTGGHAHGGFSPDDHGAGMYNSGGSPVLTDIAFSGNYAASDGGGMYNIDSSPALTDIAFSSNYAGSYGGGMFNYNSSSPALTDVTFISNTSSRGGGMYNDDSSPALTDTTFSGNSADWGGGMYNNSDSSPALTDVIFSGNVVTGTGGGMLNITNSSPALTNTTFISNTAGSGGGMYNQSSSSPVLTNVSFSGNYVGSYGGGMYNLNSSPFLTNVTFSGNYASSYKGGGMYNNNNSTPTIQNSILWNNRDSSGTGTITATIANDSSTTVISNTLVQGSGGSGEGWNSNTGTDGGNNQDADPLFVAPVDPSTAPTTSGDLHLQTLSPAINTGDNSAVSTITDLDGNLRVVNGIVDMGAYESQAPPMCFSEYTGDNATDFRSANAIPVQQAVDSASPGGTVKVAGTCAGFQVRAGMTQTVYISKTITIQGGYTTSNWTTSDLLANPTTLDALQRGRVVVISSGYTVSLEALIFTGGQWTGVGGGVYNDGALVMTGISVISNTATSNGGGIYNRGNLTMTSSTIMDNTSAVWGGGMYNINSNPSLTDITFSGNSAPSGGGMFNDGSSSPTLSAVTFSGNNGGGMGNYDNSNPTLTNVTFSGNSGNAVSGTDSAITLTHVTIYSNTGGSAISAGPATSVFMASSIIASEAESACTGIGNFTSGDYNVSSDGSCNLSGANDLPNTNPLLGSLADNGGGTCTHLPLPNSPAIDQIPNGANGCGTIFTNDQRGTTRPVEFACDVGAVELGQNYAPITAGDTYTTTEDVPLIVSAPGALNNDVDGDQDQLTAALITSPTSGTLALDVDGSFTYTPTLNFYGTDTFTYQASDGSLTDTAAVTINVSATNDAPAAGDDAFTTTVDKTLRVPAPGVLENDTDFDQDALIASVVTPPISGTLVLDKDGSFTYTPKLDFYGTDTFIYQASDGMLADTATVVINVARFTIYLPIVSR